jgi:hypothetical protein
VRLKVRCSPYEQVLPQDFTLFEVNFNPLVLSLGELTPINLHYLSEEGVLLLSFGNTEEDTYLLNLQSSVKGHRLVQSCIANKFVLPGTARFSHFDIIKNLSFILETEGFETADKNLVCLVESYPRTNII